MDLFLFRAHVTSFLLFSCACELAEWKTSPLAIAVLNKTSFFALWKQLCIWNRAFVNQCYSFREGNYSSVLWPSELFLSRFWPTAVMAKWLTGQTVVLAARVRAPHECRFSVQCKVIALPLSMMPLLDRLSSSSLSSIRKKWFICPETTLLKEGKKSL